MVEPHDSNELFPNERATAPGCQFNANPQDATDTTTGGAADSGERSAGDHRLPAFVVVAVIDHCACEAPPAIAESWARADGRRLANALGGPGARLSAARSDLGVHASSFAGRPSSRAAS